MVLDVYERDDVLAGYWKFNLEDDLFDRVEINLLYLEQAGNSIVVVPIPSMGEFLEKFGRGECPRPDSVHVNWFFFNNARSLSCCTDSFAMPADRMARVANALMQMLSQESKS